MKKLEKHVLGIVQGARVLFSDFEDDGEMWTGHGPRSKVTHIRFAEPFLTTPVVHVALEMIDMDSGSNQRADISASNVSRDGFDIVFKTWGDSRVARARASWLVLGEVRGSDEWDVD